MTARKPAAKKPATDPKPLPDPVEADPAPEVAVEPDVVDDSEAVVEPEPASGDDAAASEPEAPAPAEGAESSLGAASQPQSEQDLVESAQNADDAPLPGLSERERLNALDGPVDGGVLPPEPVTREHKPDETDTSRGPQHPAELTDGIYSFEPRFDKPE